jgi:outer membrane protein assembly factor BamA
MKRVIYILIVVAVVASCSTTRRLGAGETLYTGVRTMEFTGTELPAGVDAAVREPLNVKPNNPLFSPYVRTPLPIGLWAWNAFYTTRQTGFKAWLLRNFGKKPVLMSDVKPELRAVVVRDILDNHGYFNSRSSYDIVPRGKKRARVDYHVDVAPAWHYGTVEFPPVRGPVTGAIDTLSRTSILRTGERYDVDSISNERIRLTNALRSHAYYYFRPEYLEPFADTTARRGEVQLRILLDPDVPRAALQPYRIGNVEIDIFSVDGSGAIVDTSYNGMRIRYQEPLRVRPKIFRRTLSAIGPGLPASSDAMNTTLTRLSKLGIFRYVNLAVTPVDSIKEGNNTIDLNLSMAMDTPMEVELEGDFSYLSSSFIGPKAILGLSHKNFLRGGEVFSVKFNGGYEWQTGNTGVQVGSAINSYEVGASASLMMPRMVAPGFVIRRLRTRYDNRTTYQLGGQLLNRPRFFKMMSLSGSFSYDFQTSRLSFHSLTLLRLTYNRLLSTTAEFDARMAENEAIRRSFEDQMIPSLSYTYTFDRTFSRNRILWQSTATSAGNLFAAMHHLAGGHGTGTIFGNPFSQFVKGTSEVKLYIPLGDRLTLATRFSVGAGHAYGNWPYMPYSELFTIGGANSIRAFTIRSLGPGSYRPPAGKRFGYFDQAGTFKMEANVELRIMIMGGLHGAIFADAGNIWLLEDDPDRPGGKIKARDFLHQVATGTGVGLRYDLSFFVIRADAGIGLHLPYETSRAGYYNIPRFKDGLGLHLAIGYPF